MDPAEAEVGVFLYALKDLKHDNAKLRGSFGLRELHSNLMPGRWLEDKSEGGGLPANATASAAAEVDNMGRNSMTLKEAKVIHTNSQNSKSALIIKLEHQLHPNSTPNSTSNSNSTSRLRLQL